MGFLLRHRCRRMSVGPQPLQSCLLIACVRVGGHSDRASTTRANTFCPYDLTPWSLCVFFCMSPFASYVIVLVLVCLVFFQVLRTLTHPVLSARLYSTIAIAACACASGLAWGLPHFHSDSLSHSLRPFALQFAQAAFSRSLAAARAWFVRTSARGNRRLHRTTQVALVLVAGYMLLSLARTAAYSVGFSRPRSHSLNSSTSIVSVDNATLTVHVLQAPVKPRSPEQLTESGPSGTRQVTMLAVLRPATSTPHLHPGLAEHDRGLADGDGDGALAHPPQPISAPLADAESPATAPQRRPPGSFSYTVPTAPRGR